MKHIFFDMILVAFGLGLLSCGRADFATGKAHTGKVSKSTISSADASKSIATAGKEDVRATEVNDELSAHPTVGDTSDVAPTESLPMVAAASASMPSDNAAPMPEATPAPVPTPAPKPTMPELSASECSSAASSSGAQIIKVTNTRQIIDVKPDALIVLEVTGQAGVTLTAGETASIRGLCILASGGAQLEIDTSLVIARLYYWGRGSGGTEISFGKTGLLNSLETDLSGGHNLSLSGEKLDCSKIMGSREGRSAIACSKDN